ncbi:hypothetical protein IT575_12745 [bacterium]|nr:hypothetical protein [bacterium]
MQWRLVLAFGILFGLALGIGGLLHWPPWLGYPTAAATVFFTVRAMSQTRFMSFANGFSSDALIALVENGLIMLLWKQFSTINPEFIDFMVRHMDPDPRRFVLTFLLPASVVLYGLLIGVLSYLFSIPRGAQSTAHV